MASQMFESQIRTVITTFILGDFIIYLFEYKCEVCIDEDTILVRQAMKSENS